MFPLVDRLLDGSLADKLAAWRADGLSYFEISNRLRVEHDVQITPDTVRRWCQQATEATP